MSNKHNHQALLRKCHNDATFRSAEVWPAQSSIRVLFISFLRNLVRYLRKHVLHHQDFVEGHAPAQVFGVLRLAFHVPQGYAPLQRRGSWTFVVWVVVCGADARASRRIRRSAVQWRQGVVVLPPSRGPRDAAPQGGRRAQPTTRAALPKRGGIKATLFQLPR